MGSPHGEPSWGALMAPPQPRPAPPRPGGKAAAPSPQRRRAGGPGELGAFAPGTASTLSPELPGHVLGGYYSANFDGELRCSAAGGRSSGSSPFGDRNADLMRRQLAEASQINPRVDDDYSVIFL